MVSFGRARRFPLRRALPPAAFSSALGTFRDEQRLSRVPPSEIRGVFPFRITFACSHPPPSTARSGAVSSRFRFLFFFFSFLHRADEPSPRDFFLQVSFFFPILDTRMKLPVGVFFFAFRGTPSPRASTIFFFRVFLAGLAGSATAGASPRRALQISFLPLSGDRRPPVRIFRTNRSISSG